MSHRLVMRAEIPTTGRYLVLAFGGLPLAAGKLWEILRRFRRPLGLRVPSLIGVPTVPALLQKINVVEMMWDTSAPAVFRTFSE